MTRRNANHQLSNRILLTVCITLVVLIMSCSENNEDGPAVATQQKESYESVFMDRGSVTLDKSTAVGSINSFDVSDEGELLIVDMSGPSAFVFDDEGLLIKELKPEECHPGANWFPVDARYSPNGRR